MKKEIDTTYHAYVLSLITNIATIVLFILFVAFREWAVGSAVISVLMVLFLLNAFLTAYTFYLNQRAEKIVKKKLKWWLVTRIIANLGFAGLCLLT